MVHYSTWDVRRGLIALRQLVLVLGKVTVREGIAIAVRVILWTSIVEEKSVIVFFSLTVAIH
jgi:hypothetical protein